MSVLYRMKETIQYSIYQITNKVNGKIYIGRSTRPHTRWLSHRSGKDSRKNKHLKLYRAISKYGIDNFEMKVIHILGSFEEMKSKEHEVIISTKSYLDEIGYNMSIDTDMGLELIDNESIERKRISLHRAQAGKMISPHGVGIRKYRKKFCASMVHNNDKYYLSFDDIEEAKVARDKLTLVLYGREAVFNYPDKIDSYTKEDLAHNHQLFVDKLNKPTHSKYYGLAVFTNGRKCGALISKDKVCYKLGYYDTEIEAAVAADKARLYLYGMNSEKFNFPERLKDYDFNEIQEWFNKIIVKRNRGINHDKRIDRFGPSVRVNNKLIGLGYYEDPVKAAMVRDMAVMYFDLEDLLNYPEKVELYKYCNQYRTITQKIVNGDTKFGRGEVKIEELPMFPPKGP